VGRGAGAGDRARRPRRRARADSRRRDPDAATGSRAGAPGARARATPRPPSAERKSSAAVEEPPCSRVRLSSLFSLGRGRTRQTATSSAAGFFGSAGGGSPGSFVGSGCSFWRAMARGGRACVRTAGLEGVAMRATFVNLFGPGSDARGREPRIQGRAVDRRRSREKFEGRQNFESKNLGLKQGSNPGQTRPMNTR
jgi:hypothetical protein